MPKKDLWKLNLIFWEKQNLAHKQPTQASKKPPKPISYNLAMSTFTTIGFHQSLYHISVSSRMQKLWDFSFGQIHQAKEET